MAKIRWGVIGAGGIADKRTMPGICRSEHACLAAFAEVDPQRREKLKEKYGVRAYADAQSLLSDENIECVYVASPLQFHREQAEMVLKAGKHLLLEKPLGISAAEAFEITEMAEHSGLKAAAGFMMRFHAAHVRIHEMVQGGELGRIVSARAQFGGWSVADGKKWRHFKTLGGGGSMMDMGIHCIDLLNYILNRPVEDVVAMNATLAHDFEIEDSSCVLLRYSDGVIGIVDSYFCMPNNVARIEICGTRGRIVADNTIGQVEGGSVQAYPADSLTEKEKEEFIIRATQINLPEDGRYSCYTSEVDALCRAIRENVPIEVPLREAAEVQRIIEAAYRSEEKRGFVQLRD